MGRSTASALEVLEDDDVSTLIQYELKHVNDNVTYMFSSASNAATSSVRIFQAYSGDIQVNCAVSEW